MEETTTVRQNLMKDKNYRPYCGNNGARHEIGGCYNSRTEYSSVDGQFICRNCKWISQFPPDFIERYQKKHGLTKTNS